MEKMDKEITETKMTDDLQIENPIVNDKSVVADNSDIIDIDLSATSRRKFRINGDNSRIVELDPSDIGIITRIESADAKFEKCMEDFRALSNIKTDTDEEFFELGRKFKEVDNKMRDILDGIFQSNVSEVCAPTGSMYDPFNGKPRYEHIIEALVTFYQGNIRAEYSKIRKRISSKTSKYTKSRKK